MKRDLYYVYRVGYDKVLSTIYAKTLCTPFEIRKYVDFLTATDKFGFTYIAIKQEAYKHRRSAGGDKMNCYVTTFDRMAWEYLCNRLFAEKYRFGFIMQPRGYGKTMTSRALFMSIINNLDADFDKNTISLRWCEYFEIPNFRGRKNHIVYMAKVKRYVLPKTRLRG